MPRPQRFPGKNPRPPRRDRGDRSDSARSCQCPGGGGGVGGVKKNAAGGRGRAVYIGPARMPAPDAAELRRALAERLPDYMIPSSFMIAESLPVSAMGKVNVRALTADGGARPSEMPLSVAPTTPLETSRATIWAETLGKESVGVHDNFFDLGGDSLLAAQILSRTQDLLDIDLPLSVLFEKPTIAELAGYLHRLQSETESRRPRAEADRSLP